MASPRTSIKENPSLSDGGMLHCFGLPGPTVGINPTRSADALRRALFAQQFSPPPAYAQSCTRPSGAANPAATPLPPPPPAESVRRTHPPTPPPQRHRRSRSTRAPAKVELFDSLRRTHG